MVEMTPLKADPFTLIEYLMNIVWIEYLMNIV